MQLKEEALFTLKFDGKPVINELGELERKLQEVKEAQAATQKGTKEWAENKADIKQLEAAIKSVREEMGVSGMTVKQLEGYYRQLNREIKDLTPGTEAYKAKAADLKDVNSALANHRQTIRGVSDEIDKQPSLWERAKSSVVAFFTVASIIEGGRMIINFFVDSVKEFRAFQSAAQDLSAVTGATGKDLQYLKDQAMLVGPAFGKTGAEMLEAYKLMASAKPELLEQKELLAETTKAALTLADAGKIDLATATKVTAESLNQFGAAANQANRFINVIAAGAKEGSAEINEMGSSLKASGTVAKAANLSFEQTNAVLQSMSTIALKGEQAGTMLRNVLLKLQSGAKDTNPEIVGLGTALDNVAKKNYTAADMAKLFGTENVVAARHIVEHRKEIGELTTKLTGTQEAYTQAAKNSATYDRELAKAKATISAISVELVQGFMPAMTKGVQTVVAMVNGVRALPEFLSENKVAFTALGVAIISFNGTLIRAEANSIRLAAVEKARQVWTASATAAQWLLNTAMTANPIGLVIAGVALLVAGFSTLYNHSQTLRAGVAGLWGAMQTATTVALQFAKAFINMDIKGMADAMMNGGKKVADAFNKSYADQLASERPKQLAAHQTAVNTKVDAEKKGAVVINTNSVLEHDKELKAKAKAAETQRKAEEKKAEAAAKAEADAAVKADADGKKQIAQIHVEQIKDENEREVAKLRLKTERELEQIGQSKANSTIKAEWERALNEKLETDIAKLQETQRKKKAADEEKARQEFDKRERETSNEVAEAAYNAHRQSLEKQLNDTRTNASQKKAIATELANAERQETLRKIEVQYNAEVERLNKEKADAIRTAQEKGQNVDQIETQFRQRLQAAELQRRTSETSAEQTFQDEKRDIEEKALVKRKENQKEWFSAIKSLMDGDFKGFTDILTKKLAGETKQLSESQKKQISTIDTVGEYTVMAVQALSKLNQMAMEKQLSNINKEKNTQLNAWKEKYDKGLIGKDEYEQGLDKINKEADQKIKQAQLEGFKRQQKIDIALAVINGAQAALKSLAMLGWPLGLIAVAGAVATTAIQIAMIKRQQPPSLASGGKIRNGGVPDGPGHGRNYGDSGISLVRRDTGEEVGEMEGQEPIMVLSRLTYANNKRVVDSLLHSSLHRNGAPIYRAGGVFGSDGGSYRYAGAGDYLQRGRSAGAGLRRYEQGGWMDNINDDYQGSRDTSGGYQGSFNAGGGDGETTADTSASDAEMKAQIDASQKTQEAIAKAGELTAKNTADLIDLVRAQGYQLDYIRTAIATEASTARDRLDYGFGGLRQDVAERLDALLTGTGLQSLMLREVISTGLMNLQNTFKVEVPDLGKELTTELTALRTSLSLNLFLMRMGLSQDLAGLEKTTQTGFDTLTKTAHTDLTDLAKLIDLDLTALTLNVHDDLAALDLNVDTNLTELQRAFHLDMDSLKLAQAVQAALLRSDTKVNFTTLQTILKTELEKLRADTHTDLGNVATVSETELKAVQSILAATKNEQGYQSDLLGRIAAKDLSVSVQSFVNVFNQIDVIVDKSNFK